VARSMVMTPSDYQILQGARPDPHTLEAIPTSSDVP
jgi:hypothetical protein